VDRLLRIVPDPAPGNGGDPGDDVELVARLRAAAPRATAELIERYGRHVRRVLFRILGTEDSESGDLFQEVVTQAWQRIDQLADPRALKAWLTQIAVFTARRAIRRRRRRWLPLFADLPEPPGGSPTSWAGPELQEAARCVYRILDGMPVDERIPFVLRALEDLDLEATARACGTSLSTVRRRLAKAERRFFKAARRYEALGPWLKNR
jgi:RNA polymerase sigma-70 factor (ECF subfamily)